MSDWNLNEKQKRFAEEYIIDLNATQAATRAGYSEDTAGQIGHELLKKPEIIAYLQFLADKRAERTRVTQDKVVKELARIAFADTRDVVEWEDGKLILKPSSELDDDTAAAVCEISFRPTKQGVARSVKMHDKLSALEKLGKHLNIFTERTEVVGTFAVSDLSDTGKKALERYVRHYGSESPGEQKPTEEKDQNHDDLC